jgi:putative ABC transport system permease protein
MNVEWLARLRLRCAALLHRRQLNRDLEEELKFHLLTRADVHREAGLSAEDARFLSQRQFGNPTSFQEVLRNMWTFPWLEAMLQDIRHAGRTLRKSLGFSAATILTLSLGIGAATTIFSVANAVLLRPLPFKNPGQLYRLRTMGPQGLPTGLVGPRHMEPLQEGHPLIEAAGYGFYFESSLVDREGSAIPVSEYRVSPRFFDVFNEPMTLGRNFLPAESFDRVVLSYPIWRDVFKSDPRIIGSVVVVNAVNLTVVGVAARGFDFPNHTDIWTKMYSGADAAFLTNMDGYVRLRPGVSADHLRAELAAIAPRIEPERGARSVEFVVRPLLEDVVGDLRSTVFVLSGATGILLLIACLNVANLLFTRGATRSREIAVRGALGAGRYRIVGQLMMESLVLCSLGGALGLGLAFAAIRFLQAAGPKDLPRIDTVSLDLNVFLFALACVAATALLVGMAPAVRLARMDLRSLMQEGGRSSSTASRQSRIFGALVTVETGLAVVLVTAAGLLVLSYKLLISTNPGFRFERTLVMSLNVSSVQPDFRGGTGYQPVVRFYRDLMDRIRALPGVESVAGANRVPFVLDTIGGDTLAPYGIVGRPATQLNPIRAGNRMVTPEFFQFMGIPALAGRLLDATDRRGSPGVAVINQAFARAYFSDVNPVGQKLILPNPAAWKPGGPAYILGERLIDQAEVVGVIPDIRYSSLSETPAPFVFVEQEQWTTRRMAIVVRTRVKDPGALIPAIRAEVKAMDSTLPARFKIYEDVVGDSVSRQRLGAFLVSGFGTIALILAMVGIYGVISYGVVQRTGEIAIRAAMGASSRQVLGLIFKRGLALTSLGILLGLGGAVALRQTLASQLYGISALDLRIFGLAPLLFLGISMLACYLPARRASRIEPAIALRIE